MTWGLYEMGIHLPDAYTYFAIVIFTLTLIGLATMIMVGSKSNEKNRYLEFLSNKVSEQEQIMAEKDLKAKQNKNYAAEVERIRNGTRI